MMQNFYIYDYNYKLQLLAMKQATNKQKNLHSGLSSNKRARQLSEEVDKTAKIFNYTNFLTQNTNLDVQKLKKRIQEAKKKLQAEKIHKQQVQNSNKVSFQEKRKSITRRRQNIYIDEKHNSTKSQEVKNFRTFYHKKNANDTFWKHRIKINHVDPQTLEHKERKKVKSQGYTDQTSKPYKKCSRLTSEAEQELLLPQCKFEPVRQARNIYLKKPIKGRSSKSTMQKEQQKRRRLATDLGEYKYNKRASRQNISQTSFSRITSHQNNNHNKWARNFDTEIYKSNQLSNGMHRPINNHLQLSQFSVELKTSRKILITHPEKLHQFQMKILLLWDLYEELSSLTTQIGSKGYIDEQVIQKYIRNVTKQKYEFIYELCAHFNRHRIQRTIKLSRVLQFFSIFQLCLNGIDKKKLRQAEIINFLGYSSSSVIFIIKLFFMCYQTPLILSANVQDIKLNIINFQQKSYGQELRNPQDILRRMEHNNQIIQMLKIRCGRKHGKYCEQFITQTIKNAEKMNIPFYQISNNIFEFMAFYLHFENLAYKLPNLSYPPAPFLFLKYPKSIIIEPWGVLAYRKNDELVIRAHTSFFLSQIMNTTFQAKNQNLSITQNQDSDSTNFANLLQIEKTMQNSHGNQPQHFNLIFWTQLMPKQADFLAEIFPFSQNVYWLYRYHCQHEYLPAQKKKQGSKSRIQTKGGEDNNYICIKNLEHLGNLADNCIIIDNNEESFKHNPQNGVNLKWKGQKKDTKLVKLWQLIHKVGQLSENNKTTLKDELKLHKTQIDSIENEGKPKKFRRNKFLSPYN